jgi:hypothetical protein
MMIQNKPQVVIVERFYPKTAAALLIFNYFLFGANCPGLLPVLHTKVPQIPLTNQNSTTEKSRCELFN